MAELWTSLIPLIIGSALVPVQIAITILLLRSDAGRFTAVAWVAGITTVRLAQGVVFGLIVGAGAAGGADVGSGGPDTLLLVVVAIVFYASAIRQLLAGHDDDAPPPRWMAIVASITPPKAYGLGAGILLIGVKFWVFTLGAIAAIGAAGLGQAESVVTYLVFVGLAESIHLVILVLAYLAPARADAALDSTEAWLTANNRMIMIALGVAFGTWFMVKALSAAGIL